MCIRDSVWMASLSMLVWRAAPKEMDNRFIAILLIAEGLKAAYMIPSLLPADHFDWWWVSQYTILLRGNIFQTAHIVSILMYLCFPIYFRVNLLRFLYRPVLQKHAWYVPLILTTVYMGIQILQNNPGHVIQNFAFIEVRMTNKARIEIKYDRATRRKPISPPFATGKE